MKQTDFTDLVDLASERFGGAVTLANDEFFGSKDNLLQDTSEGWETRRSHTDGHDWCIVRLGIPGIIHGVIVDTTGFRGDYPESCSIEGSADENVWMSLLPRSSLEGDSPNPFHVECPYRFTHIRLNIFPDGGVRRLRIFGEPLPDVQRVECNLAAIAHGGTCLSASDVYFGSRHNLLLPDSPVSRRDGWATRRRRTAGHEWVVVRLAGTAEIRGVAIDTTHFKGDAPSACSFEIQTDSGEWQQVLPRTPIQQELSSFQISATASTIRFNIHPDGGVGRLRVYGTLTKEGYRAASLARLNALLPDAAQERFLTCCGSTLWAQRMAGRRPFPSVEDMHTDATHLFAELSATDWKEAFSRHPRIGETQGTTKWSAQEQAGVRKAEQNTLSELAELNRQYQEKFGYIYIVCATGKSAEEMLGLLKQRLENSTQKELPVAAAEQAKITHLRLDKLFE